MVIPKKTPQQENVFFMKNFDIFSLQIRPTEINVYLMNVTSKEQTKLWMFILFSVVRIFRNFYENNVFTLA